MVQRRFLLLIGVVLFIAVLSQFNIEKITRPILMANPVFLLAALAAVLCSVVVKALKWHLALKKTGIVLGFATVLKYYFIGFFLSSVTPGRIGEFAKAVYLRKNQSLAKSLATIFFDRLFDIGGLFAGGILGIILFSSKYGSAVVPDFVVIFLAAVLFAGILLVWKLDWIVWISKPFLKTIIPKDFYPKLEKEGKSFFGSVSDLFRSRRLVFLAAFLSVLNIITVIGIGFFLAAAISLNVSFLFIAGVVPLVVLLDVLPVSVVGVGVRDVALIFAFSLIGLSGEIAISFSLLLLGVGYLVVAFLGFLFFVSEPLSLFGKKVDWLE